MRLSVFLEQRFNQTPDGTLWTQAAFAYPFWLRYLDVFDAVQIVARVQPVSEARTDWLQANGKGVSVSPLPYYLGPRQYIFKLKQVQQASRRAVDAHHAVIFRVPSAIPSHVIPLLKRRGQPYGVEVVGDPYDVFAPGAVRHPLRPLFRWWFTRQLRQQCAGAQAAAYVTEQTLQRRYPPTQGAFTTHYSSIELPEKAFVNAPRPFKAGKSEITLITIGSLAQLYKAPDVLLQALHHCIKQGLNLSLIVVGDGKHRGELEALAVSLGLSERVCFLGQLPAGEAVRAQLDAADVFVLPSRTEGLPRAMIEAMAWGLPCIGSTAGGIPELLPPEDMVAPGDAYALAHKIREVVTNPERMARMSTRNLEKARRYAEPILHQRRIEFYQYVKSETEAWLKKKNESTSPR